MAYQDEMIAFLEEATPDVWMYVACDINYDEGQSVIQWMINQKRCPKSVALAIYWLLSPGYIKNSDSPALETDRKLIAWIEINYPQYYAATDLGFDPRRDIFADEQGCDWTLRDKRTDGIPPIMHVPIEGRKIVHKDSRFVDWLDCRPPHLLHT